MKVSGKMMLNLAAVFKSGSMALFTKAIGKMTRQMAAVV